MQELFQNHSGSFSEHLGYVVTVVLFLISAAHTLLVSTQALAVGCKPWQHQHQVCNSVLLLRLKHLAVTKVQRGLP